MKTIKATANDMLRMEDEHRVQLMQRRKRDITTQTYLHNFGFSNPVRVQDKYKYGGNTMVEIQLDEWLKGDDIAPESVVEFIDEGERTTIPQQGDLPDKEAFEIGVKLPTGEIRKWTMNMTSQRAVAGAYGKDTKLWIGRTVTLFVSEQNVNGTMRKVIYARGPK